MYITLRIYKQAIRNPYKLYSKIYSF